MGTTSEKLTYLNTTKTFIKEELNLGGANITNEPFREYKGKLEGIYKDFLANGTDTLWNNWEKVSGSGTEISLNNTIEAKMDFVYKGNTSQMGTPTPDTPIPVQVVSGDNTIKVEGKNLFDKSKISSVSGGTNNNGIITATSGNCSVFLSSGGYIPVNNGDTIYFSADIKLNSSSSGVWNNINDGVNGGTTKILYPTLSTTYQRYQTSFTYSSNKSIDRIFIQSFNLSGSIEISNIMISKNNNATYEQYQTPQTYPINIGNIELCKIGTYQDRIYKDNGKWYLNKQIGKVVFKGGEDESWSLQSINSHGIANFQKAIAQYIGTTDNISLVNYFSPQTSPISGETQEGYRLNTSKTFYVRIKSNTASTVENFKTWLSTHNTTVYYVLATPTTTEITDTTLISQLEAIKKSYNTETNISQENNDLPFELDVVALGELEII